MSLYHDLKDVKVYDISVPVSPELAVYPGDMVFNKDVAMDFSKGDNSLLTNIAMSAHCGTHIDAPAHFLADGRTIDSYMPEQFLLPAQVIEIDCDEIITANDLRDLTLSPGSALLFKTKNSISRLIRQKEFSKKYVCLSEDAAFICVHLEPALIGIDYFSIDAFGDNRNPAHMQILGAGILILEGIDLDDVPAGEYILCCLPLRLTGVEASPVRAILLSRE